MKVDNRQCGFPFGHQPVVPCLAFKVTWLWSSPPWALVWLLRLPWSCPLGFEKPRQQTSLHIMEHMLPIAKKGVSAENACFVHHATSFAKREGRSFLVLGTKEPTQSDTSSSFRRGYLWKVEAATISPGALVSPLVPWSPLWVFFWGSWS